MGGIRKSAQVMSVLELKIVEIKSGLKQDFLFIINSINVIDQAKLIKIKNV